MMTIDQAAVFLGLSRSLAYEAVRRGEIPSMRVGRRYVIAKAALLQRTGGERGSETTWASQRVGLFGAAVAKPPALEFTRHGVHAEQSILCAYCGWPIKAESPLTLVLLDDRLRCYCGDDESCSRQAGK